MKKFLIIFFLLISAIVVFFATLLATTGIKTTKFNSFITQKISQNNKEINLSLNIIKFKLDIKKLSLFLETNSPRIDYRNVSIPADAIRVYIDFFSLIKSETEIKKINFVLNKINMDQLKKISMSFKPSNLKRFINNNIEKGILNTEIEIYFKNNQLDDFIAKGNILDLKTNFLDDLIFEDTSFSFFADKSDILIKNFYSQTNSIKIEEGDIKIGLSKEIKIDSNFKSKIKFNKNITYSDKFFSKFNFFKNFTVIESELFNKLSLTFDQTYKLKNYDYNNNGKIIKAEVNISNTPKNFFLKDKINQLVFKNSEIKTVLSNKKRSINLFGDYSFDQDDFLSFKLKNDTIDGINKLNINAEFKKHIEIELVNYEKPKNLVANISFDLEKQKNSYIINVLNYKENKTSIILKDIKISENKLKSLKKVSVKTFDGGNKNNDFSLLFDKNISIKGTLFDASNLQKILSNKSGKNNFENLNTDIEIDIQNIIAPLSEKLKNFKLLGRIEKGSFTKISSKGDFGKSNFLDISMKKNKSDNKRYLEIYSDIAKPLLTEYSFFKGLSGGKLLYSSVIEENSFNSKLKIENFKVINAPGMVKLLSLADLGGLADLAEGEGISFDILEINMEKINDTLKLNEILALGPSVSVLMEGYQDQNVTSLRGTLVPAKTLNKLISKIPVIGDIVIPKEVGEGLFGISFKLKGPPGKVKTTINPIRTITPRFIQKIIDKRKNSKLP